jgi:hypothetical protein
MEPGPAIPPGTFRIDREGAWRHEGQEVTHPGVLRNLYSNLRVDAGGHFLQVGPMRIPVEVDDTPFVVTRVEMPPDREVGAPELRVHLTDGSTEPLDPTTLRVGAGGTPYCRVREGRFAARLAVAAWLQVARLIEEDPKTGGLVLAVGGRRVPVPRQG